MRFDNAFDVQAPIGEVWTALLDVERVAPCVPGAAVLEQLSPSSYRVAIKIRIGPIVQQYRGEIEIVESDESAHHAVMKARARETRGQGRAEATVDLRLTDEGQRTHGDMSADVTLSGPAAAMGRGIIQDVSSRIVEDFSKNLAAMLAGGPAAPTAEAPTLAATTAAPAEELRWSQAAPEEPASAEAGPPSAGSLPEAVPELQTPGVPRTTEPPAPAPEAPTPVEPPPVGPLPEVSAPDALTAELPIPSGPPDTAPPPQSGLTGRPPAGLAEDAAIGRPDEEEPAETAGIGEPAGSGPPGPAAAAATGGPSAEPTSPEPEPPAVEQAAAPRPEPPAAEPPRAEPPREPEPPRAPVETEAALPVLSILGDVALKRLRDPKVLASLMAALIVILILRQRRGRP